MYRDTTLMNDYKFLLNGLGIKKKEKHFINRYKFYVVLYCKNKQCTIFNLINYYKKIYKLKEKKFFYNSKDL